MAKQQKSSTKSKAEESETEEESTGATSEKEMETAGDDEDEEESTEKRRAPKGFRRRSAVSEAPWFHAQKGNVCHGKLLGRYIMQTDPPRPYYQVQLYSPCTVTVGKGDDAEQVEAKVGDVVNVGESFKLTVLKDVEIPEILAGGEYDVWFDVESKIKISGGRTMWNIDVQTKRTKAPTSEVRPLPTDSSSASDDESQGDSPF